MKKNSREEDIKNIEEIIELSKEEIDAKNENITAILDVTDLISLEHILSDYKRVLKENEELKEYIVIAPNLDEMTAIKYRNIQRDAYIQGRAEEQKRAKQIIYENFIPVQKIKAKIEEVDIAILECEYLDDDDEEYKKAVEKDKLYLLNQKRILQELLEIENK